MLCLDEGEDLLGCSGVLRGSSDGNGELGQRNGDTGSTGSPERREEGAVGNEAADDAMTFEEAQ